MPRAKHPRLQPLTAAVLAANCHSTPAVAASYDASFTGYWLDSIVQLTNVPGAPTAPLPPLYQIPRLGNYQAPGWPATMQLSIDAVSGAVTNFQYAKVGGGWFGSGGPQAHLHSDELVYLPEEEFLEQFTSGPVFCSVTNPANDADGILEYHCPTVASTARFARSNHTGTLCITDRPSTLAPGANGCGATWGGFPQGFLNPEVAAAAGPAVPANFSIGGLPLSIAGGNPTFYRSLDHAQNQRGIGLTEFQWVWHGGTFTLSHHGTLSGGDFEVTGLQFTHDYWVIFFNTGQAPWAEATAIQTFDFSSVESQGYVLDAEESRAVPAFGTAWLMGMLVSLLALARSTLRQSGRQDETA